MELLFDLLYNKAIFITVFILSITAFAISIAYLRLPKKRKALVAFFELFISFCIPILVELGFEMYYFNYFNNSPVWLKGFGALRATVIAIFIIITVCIPIINLLINKFLINQLTKKALIISIICEVILSGAIKWILSIVLENPYNFRPTYFF